MLLHMQVLKEERRKAAQELKRLEALQAEVAEAQARLTEQQEALEVGGHMQGHHVSRMV